MKKTIFYLSFIVVAFGFFSCHRHLSSVYPDSSVAVGYSSKARTSASDAEPVTHKMSRVNPEVAIPMATAFRMNGNYQNNVAVSLNEDGELTYFPAPSDISSNSIPVALGDGWWLNKQGFGPNSVFTSYTFEDYAALPETPSVEEIKAAIIPGAKVTQIVVLPCQIGQESQNMDKIKEYLKSKN